MIRVAAVALLLGGLTTAARGACCYFSAKNADILQPAQKVFITWDPAKKVETFTVQPKFEGNALDFGMVIPTPAQPKLDPMPRDFFKHLAVFTILKKQEFPQSKLLPRPVLALALRAAGFGGLNNRARDGERKSSVVVLESGIVGSLDYKIINADRADDLYDWLKDHKYHYAGDEATLDHYVQKKWLFTVMKIDTMQMKRNQDGTYAGEVTPTRFKFTSDKLVYPLKITQLSVKDKTEALFYIQAPQKYDLQGEMSYQHTWVPLLQSASGCTPGGLPGRCGDYLKAIDPAIPQLLQINQRLGFKFIQNQRPQPNNKGHIPTTMEWAKRLSARDIDVLRGEAAYSEKVPNVDEGFTQADLRDAKRAEAVLKVIRERLEKSARERPSGYLVREAPAEDLRKLIELIGHVQAGQFITKFRKIFARDEMNDDLVLVPARFGDSDDFSEHEMIFPTSPP